MSVRKMSMVCLVAMAMILPLVGCAGDTGTDGGDTGADTSNTTASE